MGNKNMVTPGTCNAPKFSAHRPHELRRFIRQMEDLWKDASITDDGKMIQSIVKYADQDSKEEWKALEAYEDRQSWDDFKKEFITNYPEAAAAEQGTPAQIRQLCAETKNIQLGDMTTLYTFQRAFLAKAKKLTKPPSAMLNRELVELFIGSLSEQFAAMVLQFLAKKFSNTTEKGNESKQPNQRPEDKYDIDKVCKMSIFVSEGSQGMFHYLNKPIPESIKQACNQMKRQEN